MELYKASLYTQGIFGYLIYLGPADQDGIFFFTFSLTISEFGCCSSQGVAMPRRLEQVSEQGTKKSFCCFVINEASLNYALDAY